MRTPGALLQLLLLTVGLSAPCRPAFALAAGFDLETGPLFDSAAACMQARNEGVDVIAEYLDTDGAVVFRAGSWLGRDGRYLLPPPESSVGKVRFRTLERISITASDVSLEPCPASLPDAAIDSLSQALDNRLNVYLGEAAGDTDLPPLYENAIEALEGTSHDHWLAVAHFEFASMLRSIDRLDDSAHHYRNALSLFESIDDPGGRAAATNSLGLVALRQGRLEEAGRLFDAARPLFLEQGDLHSVAGVDNNLGLLYMRRDQLDAAATHLEMALTVLQGPIELRSDTPNADQELEAGSPAELTWALNTLDNLAIVRRRQGSVHLAERYWRNVLALEGHVEHARTGAEARHNLGGLLLRQGRLDEALVMLSEALEQFNASKARRWMVETRVMLSRLYFYLGDSETALEFAREAVALEPDDLNARLRAFRGLADLEQERGEFEAAIRTIDAALSLVDDRPDDRQYLLLNSRRAHLQLLAGNTADAIETQRSVHDSISEVGTLTDSARVRYRLAIALGQTGQSAEARALLNEALPVFRKTREVFHELLALEALSKLQIDDPAARIDTSARAFERALQLRRQPLGDMRRLGMSATLGRIDDRHIRMLAESGESGRAWQAASSVRAVEMLDLERARRRGHARSVRKALLDEHAELLTELHRQRLNGREDTDPRDLKVAIDRVEAQLRQLLERPETHSAPSLTVVQQQLGDKRLLLSYYLLPDDVLLWAVSGDEVQFFQLPDRRGIEAAASNLLDRLRHPRQAPGATGKLSRQLGKALLNPASGMIADAEEVVIEPHGALHALPFGVLVDDGQLLMERVAVHRALAVDARSRPDAASGQGANRLLVMANPGWQTGRTLAGPLPKRSLVGRMMRDNGLARLPGTQREAELLAALDPEAVAVRVLSGPTASRQFVLGGGLSGYPLIHIATHGLLDLQYPSLSALLLADEHGPGPALLRPQEIAELQLDAGLVVLSGCETGTGPLPAGSGALSLARPFLVAGADQVLSSLWKIDDARTAKFMQAFYRHLLVHERPPARALAAAQRDMRHKRETANPYYWAGFVLLGKSI